MTTPTPKKKKERQAEPKMSADELRREEHRSEELVQRLQALHSEVYAAAFTKTLTPEEEKALSESIPAAEVEAHPALARFKRKLFLRNVKRRLGAGVFDLDQKVREALLLGSGRQDCLADLFPHSGDQPHPHVYKFIHDYVPGPIWHAGKAPLRPKLQYIYGSKLAHLSDDEDEDPEAKAHPVKEFAVVKPRNKALSNKLKKKHHRPTTTKGRPRPRSKRVEEDETMDADVGDHLIMPASAVPIAAGPELSAPALPNFGASALPPEPSPQPSAEEEDDDEDFTAAMAKAEESKPRKARAPKKNTQTRAKAAGTREMPTRASKAQGATPNKAAGPTPRNERQLRSATPGGAASGAALPPSGRRRNPRRGSKATTNEEAAKMDTTEEHEETDQPKGNEDLAIVDIFGTDADLPPVEMEVEEKAARTQVVWDIWVRKADAERFYNDLQEAGEGEELDGEDEEEEDGEQDEEEQDEEDEDDSDEYDEATFSSAKFLQRKSRKRKRKVMDDGYGDEEEEDDYYEDEENDKDGTFKMSYYNPPGSVSNVVETLKTNERRGRGRHGWVSNAGPPPEPTDGSVTSSMMENELKRTIKSKKEHDQLLKKFTTHQRSFSDMLLGDIDDKRHTALFSKSPHAAELVLKPFIRRDVTTKTPRILMHEQLLAHFHGPDGFPKIPIDYCYLKPELVDTCNSLLSQDFWPGIDIIEHLEYPEHSVVVMYGRLVVGCGFITPRGYITYLVVHPHWRRAKVASYMLYHLIQTCVTQDITLHVSIQNTPALLLYQRFCFKAEERIINFYDKYEPNPDVPKDAYFMRLRR